MFISKLQLKNFKRFTDLTIDLLPPSPFERGNLEADPLAPPVKEAGEVKLVLLIGANGSGKSCIFDAFEFIDFYLNGGYQNGIDPALLNYLSRKEKLKVLVEGSCGEWEIDSLGGHGYGGGYRGSYVFYGRSAFRNIIDLNTKFNAREYGERDVEKVIEKNLDRAVRSIDLDKRWDGDILYCFKEEIDRKELVQSLNTSLNNIFENNPIGHFEIKSIRSEIGRSIELSLEVLIKKGNSTFPYEYLSAGEKQLFSILLNLHLRKKFLEDTIVYLDEIDLHLNTSIQKDLLKEITGLIPDNSQLWVASHSLGFIDYANEYERGAIIDFDNLDFDEEKTLYPTPKSDLEVFEIAVSKEFLSRALDNVKLFLVEGEDAKYYGEIKLSKTLFSSMKIKRDKGDVFWQVINNSSLYGIRDRDYLLDEEIQSIREKHPRLFFLKYYSVENYFFHPDNLFDENESLEKADYKRTITEEKNKCRDDLIANLKGNRTSDPFFKWISSSEKQAENFKDNYRKVLEALQSDDFEIFYKFLPMKDYCTELPERQNKDKTKLAQTNWFRSQIEALLK